MQRAGVKLSTISNHIANTLKCLRQKAIKNSFASHPHKPLEQVCTKMTHAYNPWEEGTTTHRLPSLPFFFIEKSIIFRGNRYIGEFKTLGKVLLR